MKRLFGRRGSLFATYGRNSPIINAPGNSGTIAVHLPGGELYRLREAPQAYRGFADALTRDYYERNPLVTEFRRFLDARDRGYFAVEAEPGMGKSAFAAWVEAREETDAAHFVQNGAGAGRTATAVRSLGAQLVTAWRLDDLAPDEWLSGGSGEPEWLALVIERAAARRDEQRPGRPIVLVVDALEAVQEYPATQLPFGLPQRLPRGVYVVVTARTGQLRNTPADQTCRATLPPDAPENLEALSGFLRTRARDDAGPARALSTFGVTEDAFAAQILERSRGSWVYAHYVLESIGEDPQSVRGLADLPRGLDAYYSERVLPLGLGPDGQQDAQRVALLAALGAAGEPVDSSVLCSLAGLDDPSLVDAVMRDGLRPFCTVVTPEDDPDGPPRYTPHHPSLREYLSGSSDVALRQASRAAHGRICDRFLTAWGGLDSGLGALEARPELADADGGYPVRQLVFHLLEAGRDVDVHRLLALSRRRENLWYAAHERTAGVGAYLRDVELAEAATGRLGTRLRYRLIRASVTSAVTALPPGLVREMATRGFWTAEQAFHRVERMGTAELQARALLLLLPDLPKRLHPDVLALAASYGDDDRTRVLDALIPLLGDGLLPPAVELALDSENGLPLPGPLVSLAARLPREEQMRLADHPLLAGPRSRAYVRAATALFPGTGTAAGAREALHRVGAALELGADAGGLIAALLPHMPVAEVFDDVLALLEGAEVKRCEALMSALGAHVPMDRLEDLLSVLDLGPATEFEPDLLSARSAFLHHLSARPDLGRAHVPVLLELVAVQWMDARDAEVLHALIQRLSTTQVRDWLDALFPSEGAERRPLHTEAVHGLLGALLRRLPPEEARSYVAAEASTLPEFSWGWDSRAHLVEHLSPEARRPYLDDVSRRWGNDHLHRRTLTVVGPHLSEEELGIVLDAVSGEVARDADAWLNTVDVLAPHLPDHLLREAVTRSAVREKTECFAALAELGGRLRPESRTRFVRRSLKLVRDTPHRPWRADAVRMLAPALSADAAVAALAVLEPVRERWGSVRAVEALSAGLPTEALPQAWAFALRGADSRPDQVAFRAPGLTSRLVSAGHGGVVDEVLDHAVERLSLSWEDDVAAFLALVPLFSTEQVRRARDALVERRDDSPGCAEALAGLVHRLPEAERQTVTDAVLATLADARRETNDWDPRFEARALGHLYRAGATETATEALRTLLTASASTGWYLSAPLDSFGAPLPTPVVEDALAMALAEHEEWRRIAALLALAPHLSEDQVRSVLREVVDPKPPSGRSAELLTALAERLGPGAGDALSLRAFEHACQAGDLPLLLYGSTVCSLLSQLRRLNALGCPVLVKQMIDRNSPSTSVSWEPDRGFGSTVSFLEAEELAELYARVTQARNPSSRAAAQATILRQLGVEWPGAAFPGATDLLRTWSADLDRAGIGRLLAASAWWVHQRGGADAVDEVVDALIDVCTWWP